MTIHAVERNMVVKNVVIEYRDRPEGSESKLNTYSDGMKVLGTIFRLYKNNKPGSFFGWIGAVMAVISVGMFVPVFSEFFKTGLVTHFPTLIVSGFVAMAALLSWFAGIILSTLKEKDRQEFEFRLQIIDQMEKARENNE